jgi:hypothetical protein
MLEDSEEGNELKSTTERNKDLPRFGASKLSVRGER